MKEMPKEAQEKIMQLQMLQQRLQIFVAQKQQYQLQQMEIENALAELKKAKKAVYKMIGEVLVEKDKTELETELKEEQKEAEARITALDKQEKSTRDKAMELQKEITKSFKE